MDARPWPFLTLGAPVLAASSLGVTAQVEPEVLSAQRGDVAAFERLYRAHVGRVHALCVRLCGEPSLAEQLTQDAFVRAWERLESFRGESGFATWMRHVTVNVVFGERRERARRERRVRSTDDEEVLAYLPRQRGDDAGIDLERAIAALPEGARTVFVLHDIEGYRHEEIATLSGIAAATSRAHLHRARALLREALQ